MVKPVQLKSTAELNRKRLVKSGRSFRGVEPKEDKTSIAQRLEDLIENLHSVENDIENLTLERGKLSGREVDVSALDAEIARRKQEAVLLKDLKKLLVFPGACWRSWLLEDIP